jgi:hypothetical protein
LLYWGLGLSITAKPCTHSLFDCRCLTSSSSCSCTGGGETPQQVSVKVHFILYRTALLNWCRNFGGCWILRHLLKFLLGAWCILVYIGLPWRRHARYTMGAPSLQVYTALCLTSRSTLILQDHRKLWSLEDGFLAQNAGLQAVHKKTTHTTHLQLPSSRQHSTAMKWRFEIVVGTAKFNRLDPVEHGAGAAMRRPQRPCGYSLLIDLFGFEPLG